MTVCKRSRAATSSGIEPSSLMEAGSHRTAHYRVALRASVTDGATAGRSEILAGVTQTTTLEPGDLVLTGMAAGVGIFRAHSTCSSPVTE